jgi:plastocyanin
MEVSLMAIRSFLQRLSVVSLVFALAVVAACASNDDGGTTAPPVLELNSGVLGGGAVYNHVFANVGSYPYHCEIHGGMRDTIVVEASSPNAALAVSITGSAFVSSSSSIQPGGTVTWTNNDGISHTVTSD